MQSIQQTVSESPSPLVSYEEKPISAFFLKVKVWGQREWKDLTAHPLLKAKRAAFMAICSTPIVLIDVYYPNLNLLIALATLAIELFARKSLGVITPCVFNGWGVATAIDCVRNITKFHATHSSAFLSAGLTEAFFSIVFFVVGTQYNNNSNGFYTI